MAARLLPTHRLGGPSTSKATNPKQFQERERVVQLTCHGIKAIIDREERTEKQREFLNPKRNWERNCREHAPSERQLRHISNWKQKAAAVKFIAQSAVRIAGDAIKDEYADGITNCCPCSLSSINSFQTVSYTPGRFSLVRNEHHVSLV